MVTPLLVASARGADPVFVELPAGLEHQAFGSLAWADYDNDGDLDLLVTGVLQSNDHATRLYRNNADHTFTRIATELVGLEDSAVAWGDYDNDGDLDLLMSGTTQADVGKTVLYKNNGDGTFTEVPTELPGLSLSSIAWGDYDNDGDLDLVLTGEGMSSPRNLSKIFRNDGAGRFIDTRTSLIAVANSSVAWGDADNDGDMDLWIVGATESGVASRVYRNNASGGFSSQATLPGLRYASAAMADCDNDGDLDLVQMGTANFSGAGASTRIYRNDLTESNTRPTAPAGLAVSTQGNWVVLSWNAASDARTPAAGLSYNVRVGTSPGGVEVISPASGADGVRRLAAIGNAQHRTSLLLRPNRSGVFYWSVQAIDAAFAGSEFAPEATFTYNFAPEAPTTLTGTARDVSTRKATLTGRVDPNGTATTAWFEWGTTTNYGNRTADQSVGQSVGAVPLRQDLEGLLPFASYHYRLVSSNRLAVSQGPDETFRTAFLTSVETSLPDSEFEWALWGDYDRDGDLDVVAGRSVDPGRGTFIFRNDGQGKFTDIKATLPVSSQAAAAWGDYDSDGDLDLVITGSTTPPRIYRNHGNGGFVDIKAALGGPVRGDVAWGDYNNDRDLDLLIAGYATGSPQMRLFRNNGDHTFSDTRARLPAFTEGSAAWGGYDNDGDLDLLLTGFSTPGLASRVYRNDGNEVFTDIRANLVGVAEGTSVAWGDYDNDGDLDILLAGRNLLLSGATVVSRVYRNNGDGTFTDIAAGLTEVWSFASVAWGDFDQDGDLDILLAGKRSESMFFPIRISEIYRNNGDGTFARIAENPSGVNRGIESPLGVRPNSVTWADHNGDGSLDVLSVLAVSLNELPQTNSAPTAPTQLAHELRGNTLTLTWGAATDAQTPSRGLTYNLRVGTKPGGSDVLSPAALAKAGNVGHNLSWRINNLPEGATYYWSVQSVDTAFDASPYATDAAIGLGTTAGYLLWYNPANKVLSLNVVRSEAAFAIAPIVSVALDPNRQYRFTPTGIGERLTGTVVDLAAPDVVLASLTGLSAAFPSGYCGMLCGSFSGVDGTYDNFAARKPQPARPYLNLGAAPAIEFQKPVRYPTGPYPHGIERGDVNRDGVLDLIIANNRGSSLSVFLGRANGTFTQQQDYPVGSGPLSPVLAKFNTDDFPDVVVANGTSTNVSVLLGKADGTFSERVNYTVGSRPAAIAVGDFNKDGRLDLAAANSLSTSLSVTCSWAKETAASKTRLISP